MIMYLLVQISISWVFSELCLHKLPIYVRYFKPLPTFLVVGFGFVFPMAVMLWQQQEKPISQFINLLEADAVTAVCMLWVPPFHASGAQTPSLRQTTNPLFLPFDLFSSTSPVSETTCIPWVQRKVNNSFPNQPLSLPSPPPSVPKWANILKNLFPPRPQTWAKSKPINEACEAPQRSTDPDWEKLRN